MMDKSDNSGPRRPATRPFVGGRQVAADAAPLTFSYAPSRPFSFAGARRVTPTTSTSSTSVARPQTSPTPLWTVAVYQPGLEHVHDDDMRTQPRKPRTPEDDVVEASLALADDVVEAQRHASSLAAADTLEIVAHRLRRGEILLLPGASTQNEAAVVSSVLAALLGGRR
jgi:hypothetical protein